ncbi:MAG: NAD(+)/NADH kinase [Eubacteriales bacterium]|nr:NAD(+)/NADH kinase [Eubacteriales bacterium]
MKKLDRKKVYIYQNETAESNRACQVLVDELLKRDYEITDTYDESVGLITCIGGDGTFLRLVHACNFPSSPIIGINTGHLGFFQEIMTEDIPAFMDSYMAQDYTLQNIWPIDAVIDTADGTYQLRGVNEIVIRGPHTHLTHLAIEIDRSLVQEFYGDGLLISTSVGSTAYNYALGGAIIPPQLDALQITPIAPSNTNAYRCFRSSILYPASLSMSLTPTKRSSTDTLEVVVDGFDYLYEDVQKITVNRAGAGLHLIRFHDYNYWTKLKSKLL